MSFFYLIPAKGNVETHILEVIVRKRLEYLHTILDHGTINYNEYVIEGSVYDNIGHFMLCLVAISEQNSDFYNFVLTTEERLFRRRLNSLSAYDIRYLAKKILRITRKKNVHNMSILEPLQIVCQYLSLKNYAHHVTTQCELQCSLYYIKLRFYHCLEFLSKRQVEINNGIVRIPCHNWKEYMINLFKKNLKSRLYNTPQLDFKSDPRIHEIIISLKHTMPLWKMPSPNILTSVNVDKICNQFPPCMLNLHLHLRKRHRLSHEQRFNYSLFLKDIGMPINESVEFWKSEYSIAPNGHSCCHNWVKDEKKFLYGIRHMYGLEGGRKSYPCRNCSQIQDVENTSEGGCPFKSFGDLQLKELLGLNEFDPILSQINELINRKHYTNACLLYIKNINKVTINCDKIRLNFTPVKYFMIASTK